MTYSIVARDPATGELGVAVQSHYFSVGPTVPWAQPGVGAVATQAHVEISYGPRGLELMGSGLSAAEALAQLIANDDASGNRQVAMVDAHGGVAAHTGADTIPYAGYVTGEQVSCQGNIMASPSVWGAMLESYGSAEGPLYRRLLAALDAAQAEGGDLRGGQSAALLVVPSSGDPWAQVIELRVEDHPEPLVELRRLVDVHEAYALANAGDNLITESRHDEAAAKFREAFKLAPDNHELLFWSGLGAVQAGELDAGLEQIRHAIAIQPGWERVLPMLPAAVSPAAAVVVERLGLRAPE
jgi:uncharacterized Ntn-hydrolase superfamily protein